LTLRLIRDVRLRIQVLDTAGLPLRDHAVTLLVMGDRSNVAKPGSQTGQDTRTGASGRASYIFRYHENYVPLSNAYRSLTVWVKSGDQSSPRVTADALHQSDVSLTLRLRPIAP
jgi:hypothetical protein